MEIIKLSASSVKTYEQCPKKYYYSYIDKQPKQDWEHLLLGNCAHRTLEIFHNIYRDIGTSKHKTLSEIMKVSFSAARKEFKLKEETINECFSLLSDYLVSVRKNGMPVVIGIEQDFEIKLSNSVIVRGFIDRIDLLDDNTYHIVDYKTTKNVKYLEPLQLKVYGLWLEKEFPEINKFKASYSLLRHGSKLKSYNLSVEDLKSVKTDLLNYASTIRTENTWAPIPTALCNWCDFKNICSGYAEDNGW